MNWGNFILLVIVTFLLFFGTLVSMVLFFTNLLLIYNNLTTLEHKTIIHINLPCIKKFRILRPNKYDIGIVLNFFTVFGNNPLFWLLPISVGRNKAAYGDGNWFRKIPQISPDEEDFSMKFDGDFEDYFFRKMIKYSGYSMLYKNLKSLNN